jgi:regulatory protein
MPLNLELKRIKDVALKLLARREHSQKELQQKLQKKGFSLKLIPIVLQQLIEENWQSDERFADCYIRSRINAGFGPLRIFFELNQRGVNAILIEKYLKQDNNQFWMNQLQRVFAKRFAVIKDDCVTSAKCYQFLQRRGFTHDRIMQLLKGNDNEYA